MPAVDVWTTLAERNAFLPPSQARLPENPAALARRSFAPWNGGLKRAFREAASRDPA